MKLGPGKEDSNEILPEWFVSARSREIPVSRIKKMTEGFESVWLQPRADGWQVKRINVFIDFSGIPGELEAVLFFFFSSDLQ
jgi:hypothetical protein